MAFRLPNPSVRTSVAGDSPETPQKPKESGVDVILTPAAYGCAPHLPGSKNEVTNTGEYNERTAEYANDVMTVPASLAGLPALVVPFGRVGGRLSVDGGMEAALPRQEADMPVGLQLMAQFGDDRLLFEVGRALMTQEAT
ncbi:Trimeric GatFAB AmidoTransferase(AdT) complex subunit [Cladochytrium tenue]|nr:Trimeric GatFAB AmidoTransferase(AdT) complex subunit [Cladochytrium tenue]